MPLHKLSQWLAYSLIEPLQWAGIEVTDIDGLTGLAEYRNGGLFIDTGVLTLRDPAAAQREHDVDSELVVEWRALTVALLDRLAEIVRARLNMDRETLPLAKILQGGTWAAGRNIARQLRAGRRPAAEDHQRRNGVLNRGKTMEGVTIVDHPLVQHKLTLIREKELSTKSFRELCRELGILLCYEVTRDLPLEWVEIETPMTRMKAPKIAGKKLVFAPILRAGLALVEGMLDLVPAARVAHIGLYRDPETLGRGRILSEDAGRPRRAPGHRGVAGGRDRQHRGCRHRPAQGARRKRHPRRLPDRLAGRRRAAARHPSGRARCGPPRSTIISMTMPSSFPAWATPATAPTAPNKRPSAGLPAAPAQRSEGAHAGRCTRDERARVFCRSHLRGISPAVLLAHESCPSADPVHARIANDAFANELARVDFGSPGTSRDSQEERR